jgi:3-oxoadipate enol-lactonase
MLLPLTDRNLCYDLVGLETGPVVAFSHSLAADLGMWAEQVPALAAAGYRSLRIDLRGHGGSGAPPAPYTIDALADDIIAVLDGLSIARCHFVGLSIGGMIGQSLGLRHAGRVQSLMLCDTQTQSPADAATRWGPRIEAVTKAGSLEPIADATIGRWLTEEFRKKHPARWKQIRDTIVGCKPTGYIGCAQAIADFNFTARLGTVKTPTLVVCGTDDPSAGRAESQHIASLFPSGSYDEFPGARHLPNVEQPDAFNRVLLEWLDARSKSAAH